MKLYILGPAFGLPSIDAECIAAVALVKSHCESISEPWSLVASHDPPPGSRLPLLENRGRSSSGFNSIAKHLADDSGNIPGLAGHLSPEQGADATALVSLAKETGDRIR